MSKMPHACEDHSQAVFVSTSGLLILFENQIQTSSASPYRTQVQLAASFLVRFLIFIEYNITHKKGNNYGCLVKDFGN